MHFLHIRHLSTQHLDRFGAWCIVAGNHAGWSEYDHQVPRIRPLALARVADPPPEAPVLLGRHDTSVEAAATSDWFDGEVDNSTLVNLPMFSFILASRTPPAFPVETPLLRPTVHQVPSCDEHLHSLPRYLTGHRPRNVLRAAPRFR